MVLHYLVPDGNIKNDVIVEGVLYVIGSGIYPPYENAGCSTWYFVLWLCGSMAIGDTKKLGNVGGKTLAFYLVTTAVAVAVALGIGTLLRPGIGLDMSKIQVNASDIETMESTSLAQTILNIIPDNPFKVSGKWRDASGNRICPGRWCDPCQAWRARRGGCQLYQPV